MYHSNEPFAKYARLERDAMRAIPSIANISEMWHTLQFSSTLKLVIISRNGEIVILSCYYYSEIVRPGVAKRVPMNEQAHTTSYYSDR